MNDEDCNSEPRPDNRNKKVHDYSAKIDSKTPRSMVLNTRGRQGVMETTKLRVALEITQLREPSSILRSIMVRPARKLAIWITKVLNRIERGSPPLVDHRRIPDLVDKVLGLRKCLQVFGSFA